MTLMMESLGHAFNRLLSLVAACRVEEVGPELVIRNGYCYIGLWIMAAIIAIPLGIKLLRRDVESRLGWSALILGLVGILLIVPGLLHDEIRMTPTTIRVRTGAFWTDEWKEIPLGDLQRVRVFLDRSEGRSKVKWRFEYPKRAVITYGPPDLWRFNREVIHDRLKKQGVPVVTE